MVTTTWTQTAGMSGDTDTDNIENYAEQAEASKDAAAASEAAAAASATAAAASETDAESAEANASASETAAAASATSASSSATAASNSASSASTSATAAASSASAASASETASAASETAAATSESNASTSETNAATSASNASTSETNAATSATNASTSETNAAASETAAAASETAAAASETAAATSEANAATSETNAATSETNAASSASSAASSASAASTSATSASNAQTAAEAARDATLTAYDNFDDRYLGAKSSAPTVDNDGNALVAGALYFDSTAGAMKVYTGSSWVAAYVSGTDYLPFSGGTMTGDVGHGDNVKATFGGGSDLEIYSDGNNSIINEVSGTGSLLIQGSHTRIKTGNGAETMAEFLSDGAVSLYHNNSEKLATTSSGIDVSGTVVADGLTVDGDIRINTTSGKLTYVNDTAGWTVDMEDGTSDLYIRSGVASPTDRLKIDGSGDISFYEDTGTTPKFFWDASTERLGIGTSSPAVTLDVVGEIRSSGSTAANGGKLTLGNTDFGTYEWFVQQESSGDYVVTVTGTGGAEFKVGSDGVDYTSAYVFVGNGVKLDSSGSSYFYGGNVGIGTTSPSALLHTQASGVGTTLAMFEADLGTINNRTITLRSPDTDSASEPFVFNTGNTLAFETDGTERLRIKDQGIAVTGSVDFGNWTITESGGSLYFATGGTNKMKLDASGNLDVVGSVNSNATIT